jgi:transposase-like protein
MARPKDLNLERAWRQRLRRQTSSGLSIPAFCAREGVSSASFYSWRRRLTTRSLPARPEPPLFVPVHVQSVPPQTDPVVGRGVEIELPHQVRLRFDTLPEPEWLGRVVAALASLPRKEATS